MTSPRLVAAPIPRSQGLIDVHHIATILRASRSEAAVLGVTFAATLMMHLEFAILVGIALSLMLYLNRTSRPSIRSLLPDAADAERKFCERRPGQAECPQPKIVRIEGSLYFGAVNHVERYFHDVAERQPDRKHMLPMSKSMNFVDIAGVKLLAREARRRRSLGGELIRDPSRRGRRLPAGTIPRIVRNRNLIAWKF